MAEITEKTPRVRSPAYPSMSLPEAIKKAKLIYEKEGQGRHPIPAISIAKGWDYTSLNGSVLTAISALKQFGLLLELEDTNGTRQLKMTALALDLIVRQPESEEWKQAVKKAALLPKLYGRLWKKYSWPMPSDETVKTHLQLNEGYNAKFIEQIVGDYKATIALAKFNSLDKISESVKSDGEVAGAAVGDWIQWTSQGVAQFPEPRRVTGISDDGEFLFVADEATGIPIEQAARIDPPPGKGAEMNNIVANNDGSGDRIPPVNPGYKPPVSDVKQFVLTTDTGNVTVCWPSALSNEDYETVAGWLDGLKKKIKRSVTDEAVKQKNATTFGPVERKLAL